MKDITSILKKTNLNIKTVTSFTSNTYLIKDKQDKLYILKYTTQTVYDIYMYLKHFECDVLYPRLIIKERDYYYFLFDHLKSKTDEKAFVSLMLKSLLDIHNKTSKVVTLKKENFKNIYKMYQVLDQRFGILENLVRQIEISNYKDENSWIILSKYRIFLHAKKLMHVLQNKIHKAIETNVKVEYVINISNPGPSHFKGNKLINYYNAYFGILVSDIARLYVECDHLDIDLYKEVDDYLSKYDVHFYKIYFKFLVLYIYMINLKVNTLSNTIDMNNYIQISDRLKKVIYLFKDYK